MASSTTFSSIPEELLERILYLCVVAPLSRPNRPTWHDTHGSSSPTGRLAPLLTSRQFYRIGIPLFYHTIHISSQRLAAKLLNSLQSNGSAFSSEGYARAAYIRNISTQGIYPSLAGTLSMCPADSIKTLDFSFDPASSDESDSSQRARKDFCDALSSKTHIKHLTIRKANGVYLTDDRVRYTLARMADIVGGWMYLVSLHSFIFVSRPLNYVPLNRRLHTLRSASQMTCLMVSSPLHFLAPHRLFAAPTWPLAPRHP